MKRILLSLAVVLALAGTANATHRRPILGFRAPVRHHRANVVAVVAPVYAAPVVLAPVYAPQAFVAPAYSAPVLQVQGYSAPSCGAFFQSFRSY